MHTLYWSPDTGALVVQALLEELDLPYERAVVDTKLGEHRRPEFLALNPMAQVPVLRLPDSTVITETGAMLLHLCDSRPEAGLLPEPGTGERAVAYRWLFLMATGLYETDLRWYYPDRYTADPAGADGVKQAAKERMDRLYAQADAALDPGLWLLGGRFSALDHYLFMLTLWNPERAGLLDRLPRLGAHARAVRRRPVYGRIWSQHFPDGGGSPWSTWTG
jgi:glutathione S-transferase